MKVQHAILRGWAAAAFVLAATAQAAPVPVQAFFEKSAISEATISPTGRHVALVALNKEGHDQLVVVDTATFKPFVAAATKNADVALARWVNEKRLVFSLSDPEQNFGMYSRPEGLFAVDRDGAEHRNVLPLPGANNTLNFGYYPRLSATTWLKDSDAVFVSYPQMNSRGDMDHIALRKIDTRNGQSSAVEGPPSPWVWHLGPGDEVRVVQSQDDKAHGTVFFNDASAHAWRKLESFDAMTGEGGFDVVGYAGRDTLYVAHRPKDTDETGLYTYDVKNRKFSAEPILAAKGFDLDPELIRSRDDIIGLRYESDAEATVWIEPKMKQVQAKVDALLPGTVNRISVPLRAEVPIVLVTAFSDKEPGQFFTYDTDSGKLVELGRKRPSIEASRMAPRAFVRLKSRDGMDIPAWVTKPKSAGKEPLPMVVLVHGGPWANSGKWRWDAEVQFLASRGYAVIEPEFRGSVGYGRRLFMAGMKQWGLKMQDDVADATRWAVAQGIADPKRICIAGASYGGYATLMGLVNDPDLYKCGFEWVGVTDIDLMYSVTWSDISDVYTQYGMPVLVADREKDAAQIKATSPIHQASRIKAPLLMGYGGEDSRVPLKHGTDFRDAVMKTNPNVEWVVYPEESHGWVGLKNNIDWWTRVEKFLAKNIGEGAKP